MQITTVKIQKSTKVALDKFRKERESYDEVIGKLVSSANNKELKARLIEAYKSISKKDFEILEEWDTASKEL